MKPVRKRERASWDRFHNLTLEDFFNSLSPKIISEEDKSKYLISLKEPTINLWNSYQQQSVLVDYYDSKVQEAYFLRYCHLYYSTIFNLMDEIKENFVADSHNEMLQYTFVCSGPGSEAIGLVDWIHSNYPLFFERYNEINFVDKFSWGTPRKVSHQAIEKILSKGSFEGRVRLNDIECNVLDINWVNEIDDQNQKIIVMQNAMNEILSQDPSGTTLDSLIEELLKTLKETGLLIITDRKGYRITENYLSNLERRLEQKGYRQLIKTENIHKINQIRSSNCPQALELLFDGQNGLKFSKTNKIVAKIFTRN